MRPRLLVAVLLGWPGLGNSKFIHLLSQIHGLGDVELGMPQHSIASLENIRTLSRQVKKLDQAIEREVRKFPNPTRGARAISKLTWHH